MVLRYFDEARSPIAIGYGNEVARRKDLDVDNWEDAVMIVVVVNLTSYNFLNDFRLLVVNFLMYYSFVTWLAVPFRLG